MFWCSDRSVFCNGAGIKKRVTPTVLVQSADPEYDCWSKKAKELQTDVQFDGTNITGTLHYVTGYTDFSSLPEEQEGYYLVTHYVPDPEDADVHVYKTNGTVGDKVISRPDLALVSRITNKDTQKLQVYVEKDGVKSETITYDLSGLTLEPKSEEIYDL